MELFGKIFQILPRLNSGFLNTSWQTSRNIPTPKTLSKDISTPSSSPKPQSEVTLSPPISPRYQPKSPQSPGLSSKPSSPHSQASNAPQYNSFTTASPKTKSKELPSPLLSPKSITKGSPSFQGFSKKTGKKRLNADKKALIEKLSSPQSPKEPCSPDRPSSEISNSPHSEEEHCASTKTGIF